MSLVNRSLAAATGALLTASLLTGCGSFVKKPDIDHVKTVAIVSLSADEMVPWTGGSGHITAWDAATKRRVAEQAYDAFAKEFHRLGWKVIPRETVAANAMYKHEFGPVEVKKDSGMLAKAANFLGEVKNSTYFTAANLYPIDWAPKNQQQQHSTGFSLASFKVGNDVSKDTPTKLAELAKNLHVDAVALVYMDYCYTGATAVFGNGTAKMTAGSYVKMMTPDKVTVVDMAPITKRCDGNRGESDKTVAMVGGSIALGKALAGGTLAEAFDEASRQSARLTVDAIHTAMTK
jgi:hypothetical protein